ncbi:hypothetical protein P171DRAFT_315371, partial [Karstenula rhodostoma CBS 690.94]
TGVLELDLVFPRNETYAPEALFPLTFARNYSSYNPYFKYHSIRTFSGEGHWQIAWEVSYTNCSRDRMPGMSFNRTSYVLTFTTKKGAQEVDLLAPTTTKSYEERNGVALEITETMKTPLGADWYGGETCAAIAPTRPTPNPCRVSIDLDTASSISSSMERTLCKATSTPFDCEKDTDEKGAAGQLITGGVVTAFATL